MSEREFEVEENGKITINILACVCVFALEKSSSAYGTEKELQQGEFISHLFNKLVIIKINESDKNVDGDANAGLCEHNDPRRCCQ